MGALREEVARLCLLRASAKRGVLRYGWWWLPCAIGPAGVRARKREGDGATPRGRLPLRQVFYRPDRVRRPGTALPVRALRPADGWCDAAADRNYNRMVNMPYSASAETLWRADGVYDLIAVLGFNDTLRVRGGGSAIFLHIARVDLRPTAGCIALSRQHVLRLLEARPALRSIDTANRPKPVQRTRRGFM